MIKNYNTFVNEEIYHFKEPKNRYFLMVAFLAGLPVHYSRLSDPISIVALPSEFDSKIDISRERPIYHIVTEMYHVDENQEGREVDVPYLRNEYSLRGFIQEKFGNKNFSMIKHESSDYYFKIGTVGDKTLSTSMKCHIPSALLLEHYFVNTLEMETGVPPWFKASWMSKLSNYKPQEEKCLWYELGDPLIATEGIIPDILKNQIHLGKPNLNSWLKTIPEEKVTELCLKMDKELFDKVDRTIKGEDEASAIRTAKDWGFSD